MTAPPGARGRPAASLAASAVLIAYGAAACGDDPVGQPGPPSGEPAVALAVSPAPNALSAPLQPVLSITFDRALDPASVSAADVYVFGRWTGPQTPAIGFADGDTRLTLTLPQPFGAGEHVSVALSRDISDAAGRVLPRGFSWSFWTAAGPGTLDMTAAAPIALRREGEGRIQSYGAYAGDLNADGYSDLLIPNEVSNDLRVLLNDGSGGYGEAVVVPLTGANRPSTNEGADFDRDGAVDLAVGSAANRNVSVLFGGGDGSLAAGPSLQADVSVRGLCIADVDGDADPDIITANRDATGGGNVTVFRNSGARSFAEPAVIEAGMDGERACAPGDLNEDGVTDLFVASQAGERVAVLFGDGDGGFEVGPPIPVGGGSWMLASGDVDGDGHVDAVSANLPGSFSLILGDGAGGIRLAGSWDVGQTPVAIDLGDLDGDGDLDVVTSDFQGNAWTIWENLGGGSFGNRRTLPASGAGSCAILHDRDGDGDLDISGVDEVDDLVFLFRNE
ncbi:MAG: FG-GAP-like repeat-containing protein [Gemmatimonadota bacterium]